MTTLLLIRHAETDAVGHLLSGWQPGWHLNARGKQQAEDLGRKLAHTPLRAVYSSPLERAVETALPIANSHGLSIEQNRDLGELGLGEWEGLLLDDLQGREDWRLFNASREHASPPGGESVREAQQRMLDCLARLVRRHPDEQIAAVSHGDPLRGVICHLLGKSLDYMLEFEIEPASVSRVEVKGEEWVVRTINQTGELHDEFISIG
jgi:broad specificity phosphatase PhoE